MKRLAPFSIGAVIVGVAGFWIITTPVGLDEQKLAAASEHNTDIENGEVMFWAGGCASCHAAPKASGDDKLVLSGGLVLQTEFGDFAVPNISPDAQNGIGNWSQDDFLNAMQAGVSPDGRHYYPAFPYASYAKMTTDDVVDLFAFMKTLPPSDQQNQVSDLKFPFNISRGIGLWKKLYLNDQPTISDTQLAADPELLRGRYLVEGAGHCGECHTPRTLAGGMDLAQWLRGAPSPEGEGRIPGITNSADDLESWSVTDIAYLLESGFTPDFDSVGSTMADVVSNYAQVPQSDRQAIAAYLKSLSQ